MERGPSAIANSMANTILSRSKSSSIHPCVSYDCSHISEKDHGHNGGKEGSSSYNDGYSGTDGNNLFRKFKGLLVIGKVLGLIPCEGIFQPDVKKFIYRPYRFGSVIFWIIFLSLGLNTTISFIGMCRKEKRNAAELAWAASSAIYYLHGTFLYSYFFRHAREFTELFRKWNGLQLHYNREDKTLSRDVGIVAGLVFVSCIVENTLLQMTDFPTFEEVKSSRNSFDTALQTYYERSHGYWAELIPYNWFWSLLTFTSNKLALYVWNFVDILIAAFSRSIYGKFRLVYKAAEEHLPTSAFDCFETPKQDGEVWIHLSQDHSAICNLLGIFENFLSPLIFFSYSINIYFTCLQLLLGLSPAHAVTSQDTRSTLFSVYKVWSFTHLIARLYIVSISAARINSYAHQISRILRRCPISHYSPEVERIERKVNTGPDIGLSGLGCFIITKPFILSIIGVVFTFEIVLLQASPPQIVPTIAPSKCNEVNPHNK